MSMAFAYENGTYKVIKVIDGDTLFLDFNNDGIPQQEEKVRINGIDTFEVKPSVFLEWQMKEFKLTQSEALGLGYFGKEFAKKNLLNKYVKAEYSGETKVCDMGRQLMSIQYDNGKNYEQEVLKAGLATVYKKSNLAPELYKYENLDKIKANINKTHGLNLVLLNKKNNTYHKVNCEYGQMASRVELVNKPILTMYKPASCCYPELAKKKKFKIKHHRVEKPTPDLHTQFIDLYFLDPTKYNRPANYARTSASQRLLADLKNANSIEFAIYGIGGQPEIFEAIVNAHKNGKLVRGVTDMDKYHKNEYSDTDAFIKALGEDVLKTDFAFTKIEEEKRDKYIKDNWDSISPNEYKGFTEKTSYYINSKKIDLTITSKDILLVQKGIMHNKFFVIDKKIVWTGSANISSSCIGGYNGNAMIRVESPEIAQLYLKEIDQMHDQERFHQAKQNIPNNEKIRLDNETVVSSYFLPEHDPIEREIIPLLHNAKTRIYVPMFYLTHNQIIQELIEAKQKRGVDVIVILDASGAQNLYTKHHIMRDAGIPVYVENWGGKMHMKSATIDDVFILGSMNWTKAGSTNNDENLMIIYNKKIADKSAEYFKHLEKSLPEKTLHIDVLPESKDSINSCNDGLDNDHDGLTDKESPYCKCNIKYKNHK